ncbi:MAG TPA: hypothetical protein VGA13_02705 [Acidimicrobiales bacterium]
MPAQTASTLDQATAEQLSQAYNACFETFECEDDLIAPDAFFDFLPPLWRFQFEGRDVFLNQLRSIAQGDVSIKVLRTVPTVSGFVTEHEETHAVGNTTEVARRLHLVEVRDGRITEVTTYCNGGWDDELRARHAAEAPMLRP